MDAASSLRTFATSSAVARGRRWMPNNIRHRGVEPCTRWPAGSPQSVGAAQSAHHGGHRRRETDARV